MLKIEKIEAIYSQGTAKHPEDGLIINPPFFGVIDGFSAPYDSKRKMVLFDGMSGGEMVKKTALETFHSARTSLPLEEVARQANQKIAKIQTCRGIPIDRSDLLAGACFAFAKVGTVVEIIQGGDCFAVWTDKSGKIGFTKNQATKSYAASKVLHKIAELMKKHNYDRKKMRLELYPILVEQRRRDINQKVETGYAILNGQSSLVECWQKITIPTAKLKLLLLFTDGFIPYKDIVEEKKIAKKVMTIYEKRGLDGILKRIRSFEKLNEGQSHIDQREATALAINFKKLSAT